MRFLKTANADGISGNIKLSIFKIDMQLAITRGESGCEDVGRSRYSVNGHPTPFSFDNS